MNTALSDQKIHGSKYPNGNWKSQNFCDNHTRTGHQVTWYENGNMKSAGDFNKDKPVGLHTLWFNNNTKRAEIKYKDGKRDGEFTFWHSNGQIKSQGSYLSGQVVGTWTVWRSNGHKYKETDTIRGERLYWYDNGQMKSRQWCISDKNDYMPNRNWDKKGNFINSCIITLTRGEFHKKKKNHIQKLTYSFTDAFTYFRKNGSKVHDLSCHWEWDSDSDIHCEGHNDECEEKDYFVTTNRFFDSKGNVDVSIKFYEEGELDGNPCAWCFYNSEDSLIYKYIVNPETYNDINLYAELLKIDNEELNNLLLKHEEHKAVFDSSSYKHF